MEISKLVNLCKNQQINSNNTEGNNNIQWFNPRAIRFKEQLSKDVFTLFIDNSIVWENEPVPRQQGEDKEIIHICKYAKENNIKIVDDNLLMDFFINKYSVKEWTHVIDRYVNRLNKNKIPLNELGKDRRNIDGLVFGIYKSAFDKTNLSKSYDLYKILKMFIQNEELKENCKGNYITVMRAIAENNREHKLWDFLDIFVECFNQNSHDKQLYVEQFKNYVNFLQNLGISNLQDIDKKLQHLKGDFNDFKTFDDKMDAINFLQENYHDKITSLKKMFKYDNHQEFHASFFYNNNMELVDYVYDKYHGNLSELINLKEYLIPEHSTTFKMLQDMAQTYNPDASMPEAVLEFCNLLKLNNISVNNFEELTRKSVINDNNVLNNLLFFDSDVKEIMTLKGLTDFNEAKKIYLSYPNCIHSLVSNNDKNPEILRLFFDIVKKFNLANGNAVLKFYNRCKNTKEKEINISQLYDFIEKFRYLSDDNILDKAEKQHKTVYKILNKEKANFELYKDKIEKFLSTDNSDATTDMTSLDIYKKYKKQIQNSNDIVFDLQLSFKNLSPEERAAELEKRRKKQLISEYMPDRKNLKNFIINNNITFSADSVEQEYFNSCIKILNLIKTDTKIKNQDRYIKYFSENPFLLQSKLLLNDFLNSQKSDEEKQEFIRLVVSRKLPNIPEFINFLKTYSDSSGNYNNVIKHFVLSPENMDFKKYKNYLINLQKQLVARSIQIKIDNSSILGIKEFPKRMNSKFFAKEVNQLFNAAHGYNFITKLIGDYPKGYYFYTKKNVALQFKQYYNFMAFGEQNLLKLVCGNDVSANDFIEKIENRIPKKFMDFINNYDNFKITMPDGSRKVPDLTLHAILRIISRFILKPGDNIEKLYTPEYKEKIHSIMNKIYSDSCSYIKNPTNAILEVGIDSLMKVVISCNGKLITVEPFNKFNEEIIIDS